MGGFERAGWTRVVAINERERPEASRIAAAFSTATLLPYGVA